MYFVPNYKSVRRLYLWFQRLSKVSLKLGNARHDGSKDGLHTGKIGIVIREVRIKPIRYTVCPRSLVHFYIASRYINTNKTSWTFSMHRTKISAYNKQVILLVQNIYRVVCWRVIFLLIRLVPKYFDQYCNAQKLYLNKFFYRSDLIIFPFIPRDLYFNFFSHQ